MGKLIIGFIYYIMIGAISIFYRIFGINPFKRDDKAGTYWKERTSGKESPGYRFTLKDRPGFQGRQGGQY